MAIVVILGVSATIWVIARPSKPASAKHEVVDAGPNVDAVGAALPYFDHNKISENDWRARIALRQQQIAARMLG